MLLFHAILFIRIISSILFDSVNVCKESQFEPGPDFSTYSTQKNDQLATEVKTLLQDISKPILKEELKQKEWIFKVGSPDEGLVANWSSNSVESVLVDLPHRVLKPDTPLWYSKDINISEKSVIHISADDGAQLFINGNQQKRLRGEIFKVKEKGIVNVSIRVLNNAMAGGLKKVGFFSEAKYNKYLQEKRIYDRYQLLGKKLATFNAPDKAMISAVKDALTKQKESLLSEAESFFNQYPLFLAGPYLQRPAKNSLNILVETENPCQCALFTGEEKEDLNLKVDGGRDSLHVFTIPLDLENSSFFYRVRCNKTYSKVYRVNLKGDKQFFSFNVWADSQGGWTTFKKFIENVKESNDAFGIGVGDLTNNGSKPEDWHSFLSILSNAGAEIPFHLIPGNHDYDGHYDDLQPVLFNKYVRNGKIPNYFSWSYSNCAFIALDPNENFPVGIPESSAQYKWFINKIGSEEWLSADWRFVLVHQPPFSQGWKGYHGEASIRKLILETAESGKINFVISGHTHDYERLTRHIGNQKVNFLIVGGAGGGLEPEASSEFPKMDKLIKEHHIARFTVEGEKLEFEVIGSTSGLLDSFELEK